MAEKEQVITLVCLDKTEKVIKQSDMSPQQWQRILSKNVIIAYDTAFERREKLSLFYYEHDPNPKKNEKK